MSHHDQESLVLNCHPLYLKNTGRCLKVRQAHLGSRGSSSAPDPNHLVFHSLVSHSYPPPPPCWCSFFKKVMHLYAARGMGGESRMFWKASVSLPPHCHLGSMSAIPLVQVRQEKVGGGGYWQTAITYNRHYTYIIHMYGYVLYLAII